MPQAFRNISDSTLGSAPSFTHYFGTPKHSSSLEDTLAHTGKNEEASRSTSASIGRKREDVRNENGHVAKCQPARAQTMARRDKWGTKHRASLRPARSGCDAEWTAAFFFLIFAAVAGGNWSAISRVSERCAGRPRVILGASGGGRSLPAALTEIKNNSSKKRQLLGKEVRAG